MKGWMKDMKKYLCFILALCICFVWGCEKAPENQSSAPAEESKEVSVQTDESVTEQSTPEQSDFLESDTVSCSNSEATITLNKFDGWEYTVTEEIEGEQSARIAFHPEGKNGSVVIMMSKLGLCGTGLFTETGTVAGYEATLYRYNVNGAWECMTLTGVHTVFYIQNTAAEWYAEYENEIFEILDTLVVVLHTEEASQ